MCQCHDTYEPVPYRTARPQSTVVTHCHDVYADNQLASRDHKAHPEAEPCAAQELACV